MGEADVILGIKLIRSTDGIAISQSHYVEKIIENLYLANGTRPDISFSVSKLARYTSCPDKTHWGALDRVLRYLKGTVSLAIHYGRFPAVLEGYSDASWIAKNSGSNGCSGYVFTLGGGAVSWKSAKQTLITRSTLKKPSYVRWIRLVPRQNGYLGCYRNFPLSKDEVEQLQQENQQLRDQVDDLREHIDQLAEMIPDEPEENPEEDPMEYQDDDGELTEGSIIDGEV
ncbi:UNVERIFIED_CONTAM: hypothetical protein Scaly_2930700 [Sesamum calycinum]|uniref:Zinc finger, CCHC-type n=1 Tax=Sesamum calycinum TaxID=2727403 RepID=A0AAW2KU08_9LAMI